MASRATEEDPFVATPDEFGESESGSDDEQEDGAVDFSPEEKAKATPAKKGTVIRPATGSGAPTAPKEVIPVASNPFQSFGLWSEGTFNQVEIVFPTFKSTDETTNDLTRRSHPESRYWKANIAFQFGGYKDNTIRFFNVPVPFHDADGYGSRFIYIGLPGFVGEHFETCGKSKRPTNAYEAKLQRSNNYWWKVVNDVNTKEANVGVINPATKRFQSKPIDAIMKATGKGVALNVQLQFVAKASTTNKAALGPATPYTIQAVLVKGYISATNIDVEKPKRVNLPKPKVRTDATPADVASDSLMQQLASMGL